MATHKSAEKRARQSKKRNVHNKSLKSDMRSSLQSIRKLIQAKATEKLQEQLRLVVSKVQKLAEKNVIHNNTASRLVSRITKQAAALLSAKK